MTYPLSFLDPPIAPARQRTAESWFAFLLSIAGLVILGGSTVTAAPADDRLEEVYEQRIRSVSEQIADNLLQLEVVSSDARSAGLPTRTVTTALVISEDGYAVASGFAIPEEQGAARTTSVLARLDGDKRVAASIIAHDLARNLVLLKIPLDRQRPPPRPCSLAALQVGQTAVAVGRGLSAKFVNVSVGVISARDRVWGRAVQTDAKVSPANYGGVLVDLHGCVIGVLTPLSPNSTERTAARSGTIPVLGSPFR